jgi:hypothetical protein
MDEVDMGKIMDERHAAEYNEELRPTAGTLIESRQCHECCAQGHCQKEQRRRIFLAVDKGKDGGPETILLYPRIRVVIPIPGAQNLRD